ncbi:uncharacterized protein METZ01_LOCUS234692 [marine metagenome]|uniref:Uncharacterized protein n=1 Tax=marine metagenome TaxID=408172 RepID=A0A382H3G8_9ZZZZ
MTKYQSGRIIRFFDWAFGLTTRSDSD